jgi:hypothetical protein
MYSQITRIRVYLLAVVVSAFLVIPAYSQKQASPESTAPDLTTFSLMEGASSRQHSPARLSYDVPGTVKVAFQFQVQQLIKRGWKRLEGSYESERSCSAAFEKDGYKLSLSAHSAGIQGESNVTLMQHGNVDFTKLALPAGMKLFFAGPASISYLTEVSADQTKADCHELFVKAGWEPYGVAGDSLMFRKRLTRINAYISAAPAQGGKTMVQFSSELLGYDLALFPGSLNVQYSDTPAQLSFDSGKSMEEVVAFYKKTLAQSGWTPTTESLNKVSIYDVMIFGNPSADMMELQLHNFNDQARAVLRFKSAKEVAEREERAEKRAQQRMKQAAAPKDVDVLDVAVPADAKKLEIDSDSIEFQLAAGRARKIAERWRQEYIKAGWKEQTAVLQNVAGAVVLTNDSRTLTISYTDTGFMPAEVSIDATGVELKRTRD